MLPEALSSLFVEDVTTGLYVTRIYSVVEAREVERTLAEYGISYQTKIIRSRKRGIYFLISLLGDVDADNYV